MSVWQDEIGPQLKELARHAELPRLDVPQTLWDAVATIENGGTSHPRTREIVQVWSQVGVEMVVALAAQLEPASDAAAKLKSTDHNWSHGSFGPTLVWMLMMHGAQTMRGHSKAIVLTLASAAALIEASYPIIGEDILGPPKLNTSITLPQLVAGVALMISTFNQYCGEDDANKFIARLVAAVGESA